MAGEKGKNSNSTFFLVFQGSVLRQLACIRLVEGFGPKVTVFLAGLLNASTRTRSSNFFTDFAVNKNPDM